MYVYIDFEWGARKGSHGVLGHQPPINYVTSWGPESSTATGQKQEEGVQINFYVLSGIYPTPRAPCEKWRLAVNLQTPTLQPRWEVGGGRG